MIARAVALAVVPPDPAILEVCQCRVAYSGFDVLGAEVLMQTEFPTCSAIHATSARLLAEQPPSQWR